MSDREPLLIRFGYWDFPKYFPGMHDPNTNKWYMFIHKKNENLKLIEMCKNKNFKDCEIYIKDECNNDRYFKILLTGKYYIQNDVSWSIKETEIEKECEACSFDKEYSKYITKNHDVFYFDIIGFNSSQDIIYN
mgnify:CR=1 FL=1